MAISFENTKLQIEGVQSVVVSDIEADDDGLVYARLIQIYVDPPTEINRRPVLELLMHGGDQTTSDKTALEITTPPLPY